HEQIQNRAHRVDLGALGRLAEGLIFGGEVAAEFGVELRIGQRRNHGLAELLAGDPDLAVVRDPDELRDQRAMCQAIAEVAQRGGAAELRAVDPSGAPQIAEGITLESLEENEGAELLVRTILRSHGRTPQKWMEKCRVE